MDKFGKAQPVKRFEDSRFLTGQGRYVDDIVPAGALVGAVFRSSVAHGRILSLDVSDAQAMPGVHLVLTAEDLRAAGVDLNISGGGVPNIDGSKGATPLRPILATDRVRHVGEAVAFVVAETPAIAKDAAELIMLEVEELDPHMALTAGGPALHDVAPDNIAFDFGLGNRDGTQAAIEAAAHVITVKVPDNRIICNSLEPRGCYAEMTNGRLHVCVNGQGVWGPKGDLAKKLGMSKDDIRVTNPDVGGGFGMKAFTYPEMMLVAQAARQLDRTDRKSVV